MTDENIRDNNENPAGEPIEDEKLAGELESLRDTFQTVLDETTAAAENGPVIQELDYTAEIVPAEQAEMPAAQKPEEKKAKKKKEGKKSHKMLLLIIPGVLCALLIALLLTYFIITVKEPDFNNFLVSYNEGDKAQTASEKITAYEKALSFCGETGILSHFKQDLNEKIALATNEASGYAAAKAYIDSNLTEEMLASPQNKEFKELLNAGEQLNAVADKVLAAAEQAVGEKTEASGVDYDALSAQLGVPEAVKTEVGEALKLICEGIAGENSAKADNDKEKIQNAISSYLNAYQMLSAMGADCVGMLEDITVKLFGYGYAYESKLLIDQYLTDPEASENESFKTVTADLEAIAAYKGDVFADAQAQYELGKFTEADFTALLKDSALSENAVKAIAQMEVTVAEAMQAEAEHDLTKAATYYSSVIGAFDTFGFSTVRLGIKYIDLLITLGDTQTAMSVKETLLPEGTEIPEDLKHITDELDVLYKAQEDAYAVFYPYYYDAMNGGALDKTEINAALDALVTADADKYVKAYVEYYKFYLEAITDGDQDTMQKYLENYASIMADYPLAYGTDFAMLCKMNGEYEKAAQTAEKMLAVNKADDYAGSVKAFSQRIAKDVDGALRTAEESMELSGVKQYCAYEAAVALFIKGDHEKSFEYAKQVYTAQPTESCCQLIMVLNALYSGENADMKAELESLTAEIEDLYASYGLEASDAAKGLMDGSLTAEDVFLNGEYDFA